MHQPDPSRVESCGGWSPAWRGEDARPLRTSHLRRVGGQIEPNITFLNAARSDAQKRNLEFDLSDHAVLFDSPMGREVLRYLIRCALDEGTQAIALHGDEQLTFRGSVGLAPAWEHRPLTITEERWVSACLYALTNKFGKTIQVSLRGQHPKLDTETLSEDERQAFTLHEGGFFGNFFAAHPSAYACIGDGLIENPGATVLRDRVCAIPAQGLGPNDQRISACGFIVTGPCASPSSFTVQGSRYEEVVHVYLRPDS